MNDHWHQSPPNSMNIVAFGMEGGTLKVIFAAKSSRSKYQYTTNEQNLCCRWEMAESIGKFFHQYVKPLPYARLE